MSQFGTDYEQIKLSITEVTEKINDCITKWYQTHFPDDLADFTACCNEDEKKLLVECYNIFSKNNNLQVLDYDFIKALLMYYYIVVVFEYYVTEYVKENDMNCLENMLTTEKSKEYYDLLYRGSEDWISQIRRLILNMNTEPFEGYKGGKKILKKNTKKKRNLKKIFKKSRKNKEKKRVNKIKYTKK